MEGNLAEFSGRYLAARARVDELNSALKDANAHKATAEEALVDAMVNAGVTSFKTDDGVGIRAQRDAYWSCTAEQKDALYAALRADGKDYMFSVPAATLNKFANDMIESQGEIKGPFTDLLKPFEKVGVRVDGFKKWKGGTA